MDAKLQCNCEKLIQYREAVKKKLTWNMAPNEEAIMSAFMHLAAGKELDADNYVKCRKILKENAGLFSEFRGYGMSIVINKMMLSDDPEKYVKEAMEVYKKFRQRHKLWSSPYMVMAALTIYEKGGVENADHYLDQLETLYDEMKSDHPWLVWDDDRGYIAMLVCAGITGAKAAIDIDDCYQACKKITIEKDSVHSLSQVLSLSGLSVEEKTGRFLKMFEEMKNRERPVSKAYGLAALGTLIFLDMPVEDILDRVCEADDYLENQKGFRLNGGRMRRLYACLLVLLTYADSSSVVLMDSITGTLAMQIVEEIIEMIIIASITAANIIAASSSSN